MTRIPLPGQDGQTHRERVASRAALRREAERIYGGRCAQCDVTERLEFDHVDNDGRAHREREHSTSVLRRIVEAGAPLTDVRLQLLCPWHHFVKTNPKAAKQQLNAIIFQLVHRVGELNRPQYDQLMAAMRKAGRPAE